MLKRSLAAGWPQLTAVLLVNAYFLQFNAFRTFYPFDMGSHLDAAWRMFLGQRPYVDFMFHTGPVHYAVLAAFFAVLGFGKTAIWTHLVMTSSLVILAVFMMIRGRLLAVELLIALALSAVSFYWAMSFPWYNHTAHLWPLLALAWILRRYDAMSARQALIAGFVSGLAAALSVMTKTNVGLAYGLVLAVLLTLTRHRVRAIGGALLAGTLTLGALRLFLVSSASDFLDQVILQYGMSQSHRWEVLRHPQVWGSNDYWPIALMGGAGCLLGGRAHWRRFLPLPLIWFAGIASTYTSSIVQRQDVQALGLYTAYTMLVLADVSRTLGLGWRLQGLRCLRIATAVFAVYLVLLHAQYGWELQAWKFPDNIRTFSGQSIRPAGNYPLRAQALAGWKMDEFRGRNIDALVDYVENEIPPAETLLILTDMQILYPLTGRESYRNVPFAYSVGAMPVPGRGVEITRENILKNPPDWILTHHAPVNWDLKDILGYLKLEPMIRQFYTPQKTIGPYIFLKRTPEPPLVAVKTLAGEIGRR